MPTPHPRPWHRNSVFGDGPRMPMCRERRSVWKARIEIQRRAGQVTDGESYVGQALLKRLSQDGRCDPSHQTLADDSGESVSTVKRALKAFWACGLVNWVRRLWRNGTRVSQDTNAYMLTLGEPPQFPRVRCDRQLGRETSSVDKSTDLLPVLPRSVAEIASAQAALTARRRAIEARLLNKGSGMSMRGL
jgi:DNA-binding transcriptional MocR family regulator